MSRQHFWHYLCNEEGQPIDSANISIYQAETSTALWIYTQEDGGTPVGVAPQVVSGIDGFFEFWVADSSDTSYGYGNIKIKIAWEKAGTIDAGSVDNIDFQGKKIAYYTASIGTSAWSSSAGLYYYDITHSLYNEYPLVMVYGDSTTLSEPVTAGVLTSTSTRLYRLNGDACKVVLLG